MSLTMIEFRNKQSTKLSLLKDVHSLRDDCVILNCNDFAKFIKELLNDLKRNKCTYFNSILGQLITLHQENDTKKNEYTKLLSKILVANNVIITDIKVSVFLCKLKMNKYTDDINYLILPNFILWDHNFLVFLNKKFNSKKAGNLVNVWGCMQKISLTQGVIKDLIQNKNGYAGQYLYSTFLNTSSFYANVQCFNGLNEIIPPKPALQRYYGRKLENIKAWNTRHPNISQLSTQYSRVRSNDEECNWNVKIGLGTFVGSNRDCDGDKEVITFPPYPNSLIDFESLMYCDPKYSFLCFDKNKLVFVSQQIYYLYKNINKINNLFEKYEILNNLWQMHRNKIFSQRLECFFKDVCLVFSSNCATLIYEMLTRDIDKEEMVCDERELSSLTGCFQDIIQSGAKGSKNLIDSTTSYRQTNKQQVDTVACRAITGLNSHITSHGRVKFSGGDVYHNSVIFLNLYLDKFDICYKQKNMVVGELGNVPEEFLFPSHLLDIYL
uniref:ORF97 protein n=1 Tax=Plutella xylostella granulovirus TaxID=98383 RepID=A0A7U3RLU8_9BBAC|nr:ORF97 protein [Plutella xylostella granulovirus]